MEKAQKEIGSKSVPQCVRGWGKGGPGHQIPKFQRYSVITKASKGYFRANKGENFKNVSSTCIIHSERMSSLNI